MGALHSAQVGVLGSPPAGPGAGWRVEEGVRGRGPPGVRAEIIPGATLCSLQLCDASSSARGRLEGPFLG